MWQIISENLIRFLNSKQLEIYIAIKEYSRSNRKALKYLNDLLESSENEWNMYKIVIFWIWCFVFIVMVPMGLDEASNIGLQILSYSYNGIKTNISNIYYAYSHPTSRSRKYHHLIIFGTISLWKRQYISTKTLPLSLE